MDDNWTEFLGCHIDLSRHPLHPRPETEHWVEQFEKHLAATAGESEVLDLFTGSGCIGIAIATHMPHVRVTLADTTDYVSTPLPPNAHFVRSDIFSTIKGKFDFILANPPYVPEGAGTPGIMEGEPYDALYAGADGLSIIRPFLAEAPKHLEHEGQVWMEFGTGQKEDIENLLDRLGSPFREVVYHRDQYGQWRWLVARAH